MSEIQLYQGQLVYPTAAGEMRPVPVEVARDFLPIMQAFTQGQIAPHVYQNACDYVLQRSRELELVGQIAGQAIASHQAVNEDLAATIRYQADVIRDLATSPVTVLDTSDRDYTTMLAHFAAGLLAIFSVSVLALLMTRVTVHRPAPVQAPATVQQGFI